MHTCSIIKAGSTNCIYFIKEDEAGLLAACHLEKLAHHTCTFTNVFLDQLTANDTDEACICSVGDSSSKKRFACNATALSDIQVHSLQTQILGSQEQSHATHRDASCRHHASGNKQVSPLRCYAPQVYRKSKFPAVSQDHSTFDAVSNA